MNDPIAIVGLACIYPDARNAVELWENVLAQRRAFRRFPSQRLRLEDYYDSNHAAEDRTYATEAAVIEGYQFDRVKFRVVGSTYRQTDLAHWLALDVASRALTDAGFEDPGVPRENTGVIVGNTLTGEFSRANLMRLRWPYVRRVVTSLLEEQDWTFEARHAFLEKLEARYKQPFPAVGDETLAGGLSNTIAGRICNHFDFKGGGYTVDGACASSLLAVTQACASLTSGDLDLALAGGVDLSLDPFEVVGFAKVGALAADLMRVFDARSAGFWPGEGCGFIALMRREDAIAQGKRIYAVIPGWGVSSDGSGGITRPEMEGQLHAVRRAYRRAGFGPETVAYFEGHGTGTQVGDDTELKVLSQARREAGSAHPPAVIGSIKANIGHTKAAAGVAGLIKATLAIHRQVIPPTTGCETPHPLLQEQTPSLRITRQAQPWPIDRALRAGVSAMGFGGINTHIVLEGATEARRHHLIPFEIRLSDSPQDAEIFLWSEESAESLRRRLSALQTVAHRLSRAELADLAGTLALNANTGVWRAAVIAASPRELSKRLATLQTWLEERTTLRVDLVQGIFLGSPKHAPRIGFLFPGQGSPAHLDGGSYRRRFESVRRRYEHPAWPAGADGTRTEIAQPAVVTASLAGWDALRRLGIEADLAVGHSLGELTALHWAGAYSEEVLLRIAADRGRAMSEFGSPHGAMAALNAPAHEISKLFNGDQGLITIAGRNSPKQTVVSGESTALQTFLTRARTKDWHSTLLPVTRAFHTELMSAAIPPLRACLAQERMSPLQRMVFSTVTGEELPPDADLPELLCQQVTAPVQFMEALRAASATSPGEHAVDLWIEVGPGRVLSGLAADVLAELTGAGANAPLIVPMDAGGPSLKGWLEAVAAVFVSGAPIRSEALFDDRFTRPFDLDREPKFFVNPCELAPLGESSDPTTVPPTVSTHAEPDSVSSTPYSSSTANQPAATSRAAAVTSIDVDVPIDASLADSPHALVRQLISARTELPLEAIHDESRMLSDLHLNSITVGQLIGEAARRLALPPITGLNEFANASVARIAQVLEDLRKTGPGNSGPTHPALPDGVDTWIRAFAVEWIPCDLALPLPESRNSSARAGSRATSRAIQTPWTVLTPPGHPLANSLLPALAELENKSGVVVCVGSNEASPPVERLLAGVAALNNGEPNLYFVLVQSENSAGGFARTLHQEMSGLTTCVINLPVRHAQATQWIQAEIAAASGFVEARYDEDGHRYEPRLRTLSMPSSIQGQSELDAITLGPEDVLLVTGGGKGIAAECALALAKEFGVRLALVGRSDPSNDPELSANLERMTASGITCLYLSADVCDRQAISQALRRVREEWGPITALIHGAGSNEPRLIASLDVDAFRRTLDPKIKGLRNILQTLNEEDLNLLVTFGSIIARIGLPGEADYAVANEWLTRLTEEFQTKHPRCRCLALEWSVWSGVGMGQRLGRLETLRQQGITAIAPEDGIAWLVRSVRARNWPTTMIITGRFGESPTLALNRPELPLRRFLEQPRLHIPGVELVADATLSSGSDPYLEDHVYHGERLFPAVMGLEAMAQVAMALKETTVVPRFERVQLHRPIVVPREGSLHLRTATILRENGEVDVILRTSETGFQVDHFAARCTWPEEDESRGWTAFTNERHQPAEIDLGLPPLDLAPRTDLYGDLFFHTGRFQRVLNYRLLRARECLTQLEPDAEVSWFGRYLPSTRVLGDCGVRDAAIHAIQACIPHARLLPVSIGRVTVGRLPCLFQEQRSEKMRPVLLLHARETRREGDTFHYDLRLLTQHGETLESWEDLCLRKVDDLPRRSPWVAPLLAPYLERRLEELLPRTCMHVSWVHANTDDRREASRQAIQTAVGEPLAVRHRPDGKPEIAGDWNVSAAHASPWTLGLAAPTGERIGCDLEKVVERPEMAWHDLLGPVRYPLAKLMAAEGGEPFDQAATRVWTMLESLKKAGGDLAAPLIWETKTEDGWFLARAGSRRLATCAIRLRGQAQPFVACFLSHVGGK